MTIDEKIKLWTSSVFDSNTQKKVKRLQRNKKALYDAFYTDLHFGTGGMRGKMGVGTNRINKYTLGRCTQGLANYLNKNSKEASVVIAYDSRHNSKDFAQQVAEILTANGITVYLYSELRTTPQLSFTVRHLKAQAGVVLTASHNPPEYNGYKVYGADGGQMVPPMDAAVLACIEDVDYSDIVFDPPKAQIIWLDVEADAAYWNAVLEAMPVTRTETKRLKIVFTSLHGTAITAIPKVLAMAGFYNLSMVKKQMHPNGDFPTVSSPNPEEPDALKLALNQARKENADLVIGTDPDCDRLGVGFRLPDGNYELLDGNQLMILLTEFVLEQLRKQEKLSHKNFIATTIVSTPLLQKIAARYKIECVTTLTGFKWIGQAIEQKKNKTFVCGGEESNGFLIGDSVRDKDAVSAALLCAEMAAALQIEGKNLLDQLQFCYQTYGFSLQRMLSVKKEGEQGVKQIANWMLEFRNNPPQQLSGSDVIRITDYQTGIVKNLRNGNEQPIELPTSNVLQFESVDGSLISIRPSGTEPKIKCYLSVNGVYDSSLSWQANKHLLEQKLDRLADELKF